MPPSSARPEMSMTKTIRRMIHLQLHQNYSHHGMQRATPTQQQLPRRRKTTMTLTMRILTLSWPGLGLLGDFGEYSADVASEVQPLCSGGLDATQTAGARFEILMVCSSQNTLVST